MAAYHRTEEEELAHDISHIMTFIQDDLPTKSIPPTAGSSRVFGSAGLAIPTLETVSQPKEASENVRPQSPTESEAEAERIVFETGDNLTSGSDTESDTSSGSSQSDTEEISPDLVAGPTKRKRLLEELSALTANGEPDECEEEDGVPANNAAFFASKNEIVDPSVQVPTITEVGIEEAIEEIGEVMSIVDSIVIVKTRNADRTRIIDSESLLVFDNRKVLGFVFETFGPVAQPMYSVRFPTASLIDIDLVKVGRPVYFVPARSSYVFAEALKRYKGSDASNAYDEEPGDDEVEFSDDEKESEFKRNKKQAHAAARQPMLQKSLASAADDGIAYDDSPYDDQPSTSAPSRAEPAPYDDDLFDSGAPRPLIDRDRKGGPSSPPTDSRRGRGRGGSGARGRGDVGHRGRRDGGRGRGRGRGTRRGGRGGGGSDRDAHAPTRVDTQQQQGYEQPYPAYRSSPTSMAIARATGDWTDVQPYDPATSSMDAAFGVDPMAFSPTSPFVQPHINPLFANNFGLQNPYMQQFNAMQAMGTQMYPYAGAYGYDSQFQGGEYYEPQPGPQDNYYPPGTE